MKKLFAIAVLAVAGCSTTTGIVPVGDGTYMLGAQSGTSWSGSTVKAELFKEAAAHCGKQGKKLRVLGEKGNDAMAYTSHASAEIRFTCE